MAKTEFLDINARRKKVPWWRIFRNSWLPWYAFVTLVTLVILIAVSILFFDLNPYDQQSSEFFKKPNITFSFRDGIGKLILGTDDLGRDVYARLMYGCKNTFLCSFGAATISYIIGMLLGFITSVYSNPVTGSVRYFIRTMNSYTPMIFVFAIVTVLGPSIKNTLWAITVSLVPRFTNTCYNLVDGEKKKEYVKAVTLDGASPFFIFKFSIFPNIRDTLISQYTKGLTMAILDVTSLGFLGLCVKDPEPELGCMIAENMDLVYTGNYWLIALPGLMIVLFVIMINIIGDGIRTSMHKESS